MSYRSLLVPIDQDPLCAMRVQTALHLSKAFEAKLTGLAPTGLVDLPAAVSAAATLAEFADQAWNALRDQAQAAAVAFDKACARAEYTHAESVVAEGDAAAVLLHHAMRNDLIVVSQPDPSASDHAARRRVVEQVILYSARPTLVLPYAASGIEPGRNVLVAWDDSREAARAAADALPFLKKARKVHLVSWHEKGHLGSGDAMPTLQDVGQWLRQHGVKADTHVEIANIPIQDAMLSRAADLDVDLLVMGAYGHTRWSERVLGGATRGLLATMTVPVLMSH